MTPNHRPDSVLITVGQRDRIELDGLLRKAARHRDRIKELQTALEQLNQHIARVQVRTGVKPDRRRVARKK